MCFLQLLEMFKFVRQMQRSSQLVPNSRTYYIKRAVAHPSPGPRHNKSECLRGSWCAVPALVPSTISAHFHANDDDDGSMKTNDHRRRANRGGWEIRRAVSLRESLPPTMVAR